MSIVLCTQPLPAPAPALLAAVAEVRTLDRPPSRAALIAALEAGVDVLCPQLVDPVDAAVLAAGGPRLRAVCTYAVGVDNIDVTAATRRGVAVGNTPGVLTDATADCALGLLLAAARRLAEGDRLVRAGGGWGGWAPDFMLGLELRGALLGIVGMGRIGQGMAVRAAACGMRIAYAARDGEPPRALPSGLEATPLPLARLLAEADVVSLHVPLTAATHHLIDEAALRSMRPGSILVNTARGAIVDEPALARALREGWIGAAGLDVYEREPRVHPDLLDCPTAVLAPHLGSATVRTRAAMAAITARNAIAALRGEALPHWVNPEAWAGGAPAPLAAP